MGRRAPQAAPAPSALTAKRVSGLVLQAVYLCEMDQGGDSPAGSPCPFGINRETSEAAGLSTIVLGVRVSSVPHWWLVELRAAPWHTDPELCRHS
jgi:hypothetical protein